MEKISGIIPANARTRSVDVSNSQPVRPGAPTWGRRTGHVTQAETITPEDRVSLSSDKAVKEPTAPIYNNRAEMTRAKVVDQLATKFFDTKNDVRGTEMAKSEETLAAVEDAQERAPVSIKD